MDLEIDLMLTITYCYGIDDWGCVLVRVSWMCGGGKVRVAAGLLRYRCFLLAGCFLVFLVRAVSQGCFFAVLGLLRCVICTSCIINLRIMYFSISGLCFSGFSATMSDYYAHSDSGSSSMY